jgi:hypothetical protein
MGWDEMSTGVRTLVLVGLVIITFSYGIVLSIKVGLAGHHALASLIFAADWIVAPLLVMGVWRLVDWLIRRL